MIKGSCLCGGVKFEINEARSELGLACTLRDSSLAQRHAGDIVGFDRSGRG